MSSNTVAWRRTLDGTDGTHEDEPRTPVTTPYQHLLRGELVLNEIVATNLMITPKKMTVATPASLERSPDTLYEEEREDYYLAGDGGNDDVDNEIRVTELSDETDERTQLDQLVTSFDKTRGERPLSPLRQEDLAITASSSSGSSTADFIRDIFYVPTSSTVENTKGLNLHVASASCPVTHPMVTFVGNKSPLAGRLFVGDFVLRINETEAGGMKAEEVLRFLAGTRPNSDEDKSVARMVKLTVMSSQADGSDTDNSIDLGISTTAAEV